MTGGLGPTPSGQVSPDGMWRWDGTRWQPTSGLPGPPYAPRRSYKWIWWVAGGCALLVVIGVAAIVIGSVYLVNAVQHGSFTCLPGDFPKYPGTTVSSEYTNVGSNVPPGDTHECQMTLQSQDDAATVSSYYSSRLSAGDWTVTASDPANGTIDFSRTSRPATVGRVQLLGRGQHTEIDIRLDS
ncbi:MAG: hypothetical protein ACHQ0J_08205 [Candidatus Dormibacterales bacterium]